MASIAGARDEHAWRPVTAAQMVEIDRVVTAEGGVSLVQMMENAGRGLAAVARRMLGGDVSGRKIVILAGKGNKGGGGLVAARHLANSGADVAVALVAGPGELGLVPEQQRHALARMGVPGSGRVVQLALLPRALAGAHLVIDALVGFNLRGAPREPVAECIRLANACHVPRLALDLPSGLEGDRGKPQDPCLVADLTMTLAWPKAGLLSPQARPFVGDLWLADVSVPATVYHMFGLKPGTLFARGPIVRVRVLEDGWEPAVEVVETG